MNAVVVFEMKNKRKIKKYDVVKNIYSHELYGPVIHNGELLLNTNISVDPKYEYYSHYLDVERDLDYDSCTLMITIYGHYMESDEEYNRRVIETKRRKDSVAKAKKELEAAELKELERLKQKYEN